MRKPYRSIIEQPTNRHEVLNILRQKSIPKRLLEELADRLYHEEWTVETCGSLLLIHFKLKPTYVL